MHWTPAGTEPRWQVSATVGAGCDQQQRSELSLAEPMDSSILGHFSWLPGALVAFLLPMTVWGLCQG